jgi:hypothetical protein
LRRQVDVQLTQPRIGSAAAVALTAELRASLEADTNQEVQQ